MQVKQGQLPLFQYKDKVKNGSANKITTQDKPIHDWFRFVLSFPPHLIRDYIKKFELDEKALILDPFCGTGTTLVEAKLNHYRSIGIEANPFAHFASSVKTEWDIAPDLMMARALEIADHTRENLYRQGIDDNETMQSIPEGLELCTLDGDLMSLLLKDSISPLPLHKTLILLDSLRSFQEEGIYKHLLLALANALVFKISNLRFGPEVGVSNPRQDVSVISNWLAEVQKIYNDLKELEGGMFPSSDVYLADSRECGNFIAPKSVDAIITSPPYPNEKDYTRTTRLELVLLGFIKTKDDLRKLKKNLIRSNTRSVYKMDDDDKWLFDNSEVQRVATEIEQRRLELGKTSGFEKLYSRVTKLYFGGMARHLSEMKHILRPGARLAYVVGDQASYLRVMIRTGEILSQIAEQQGYQVLDIDLFRTRFATATKAQLREEVLILRYAGG
jgi:DNA modification methylase